MIVPFPEVNGIGRGRKQASITIPVPLFDFVDRVGKLPR